MLKRPPGTGRRRAGLMAANNGTSPTPRAGWTGWRSARGLAHGAVGALISATCLLTTAGSPSASATSSATPSTTTQSSSTPSFTALYAWGSNSYGELGDGTADNQVSAGLTTLAPGVVPTAISAGIGFSLAIGSDSNLYAWGTGYLGDGTDEPENSPERIILASGVRPTAISAGGDDFSLAIGSDGNLYAWGSDLEGQLGDSNSSGDIQSPEEITLAPGVSPTAISAGYSSSLAIGSNGELYAWGSNGNGQLSDGTTTDHDSPEVVTLPPGVKPAGIAEGNGASYAIGSDGDLYAWGDNEFGQLGENSATGPATCGDDNHACATSPVAVTVNVGTDQDPQWGPLQATAVAASQENWGAVAIGSDGDLYGWGLNFSCSAGQLPVEYSPQVISLGPGVRPTAVSASECDDYAIGSDGNLYGWGWNVDGELGNGTTNPEANPEKITLAGGITPTAIAANYNYALSIGTTDAPQAALPEVDAPPAGLPEAPLTVGLPVVAVAILVGGLFVARRRARRTSPAN